MKQLVTNWGNDNELYVIITLFTSAEAFQFVWNEDKSFDVLLLDIQMTGQNGMAVPLSRRLYDEVNRAIKIYP